MRALERACEWADDGAGDRAGDKGGSAARGPFSLAPGGPAARAGGHPAFTILRVRPAFPPRGRARRDACRTKFRFRPRLTQLPRLRGSDHPVMKELERPPIKKTAPMRDEFFGEDAPGARGGRETPGARGAPSAHPRPETGPDRPGPRGGARDA